MPYVKQEIRKELDEVVEFMKQKGVKPDGKLNYILYKFCLDTVDPSYNNFKNYLAELHESEEEIRRRILAAYEDSKKQENGDVGNLTQFMYKYEIKNFKG